MLLAHLLKLPMLIMTRLLAFKSCCITCIERFVAPKDEHFSGDSGNLHVVVVEKDIFLGEIADQETVILVVKEELEEATVSKLRVVGQACLGWWRRTIHYGLLGNIIIAFYLFVGLKLCLVT